MNLKFSFTESGDYKERYWVLQVVVVLVFIGLAARAFYLQIIDKDFLRKQGDARMVRSEVINAHRGMIMDRNGIPLAVSTPVTSIWINPKEVFELAHPPRAENPKKQKQPVFVDYNAIASAIGMEPNELRKKVEANPKKEFMYLKRHLAPDVAKVILEREFPAVYGINEYHRYYPQGEATAHVIGFTDLDDKGREGVELAFDKSLTGISGLQRVIKDRKGRKVKDVMQLRPAKAGQDIYLSFDARVQYIAHRELAKAVQEHEAEAAYLVAIDVKTGEILAMVNQPAYNPNNRSKLVPDQLRNRSITDMFEPGSTMKVFTVMAALESGKYTTSSLFNTNPGRFQVYNKTVTDHNNYGIINLETLIVKSSNVASAQIAGSLPKETLPMIHRRFGFGSVTESGFPGESRGILQPPQRWNPVEVATMSYGYGVSVTALQLARAYAAIANHGVSHPISLTKLTQAPQSTPLISEKIVQQLLPMMESVVSLDGTAIKAAIPGYRVAGKTGTAHKAKAGGYAKDEYMSLFAGLAPASDPRVAMVVVMDGAKKGGYYGGTVSAPVFSRVMAETLRLMNIPLDKSLDALLKPKLKQQRLHRL
jgi:cell division protein FtsI (penicillin-binding protein 3)